MDDQVVSDEEMDLAGPEEVVQYMGRQQEQV